MYKLKSIYEKEMLIFCERCEREFNLKSGDISKLYTPTLFDGTIEGWIRNCKQIQHSDKLSVVKSAFNYEFNLKLTNKNISQKLQELLRLIEY